MFSLKTVANQLNARAFKYFGSRGIQMKSTSRRTPAFDEKYTDVVDRLIRQSKIRKEKVRESKKGYIKPSAPSKLKPQPKAKQNTKNIKMTITKDGITKNIIGKFTQ